MNGQFIELARGAFQDAASSTLCPRRQGAEESEKKGRGFWACQSY